MKVKVNSEGIKKERKMFDFLEKHKVFSTLMPIYRDEQIIVLPFIEDLRDAEVRDNLSFILNYHNKSLALNNGIFEDYKKNKLFENHYVKKFVDRLDRHADLVINFWEDIEGLKRFYGENPQEDFEALPNTTGRESPLIFDTVEIPESRNIKTINGSVTILPERTMLLQNYPNPFNPETWLPFQLAHDAVVILRIYNQKGQLVRTLLLGAKPAGMYISKDKAAYWDGRDAAGERVANGVYFYTLLAGDFLATQKLVVLK